jgi:hypothetical protein
MSFFSLQLLEKDPALSKYHSVKDTVTAIKRFGDVLVILVTAGKTKYPLVEIYYLV